MIRWLPTLLLPLALVACGDGGDGYTPPTLDVSPQELSFDAVPVDTEAALSFTVRNAGDGELTLNSISLIEGQPQVWDVERGDGGALGAGEAASVTVTFSPTDERSYQGRIQIRSSDSATGSVYVVLTGSGGASIADDDGDGYTVAEGDCDDDDADRHPGAAEACDGKDNDCDGVIPARESDADYDGFRLCSEPADCDDDDEDIYPGAPEICDGADSDCDGRAQDDSDVDGDGYSICAGDCDDADASRSPGQVETCDGADNDCSGAIDDVDGDGDGHTLCDASGDCDDADPQVHPEVVGEAKGDPAGTPANPWPSVADALAAWGGDPDCPIFVSAGTWPTSLSLTGRGEVVIVGPRRGKAILTPPDIGQAILTVGPGTALTLRDLTLSEGSNVGDGGALAITGGDATLERVTVTGSVSGGDGGAIAVDRGALSLSASTLSGNLASGDGGAISLVEGQVSLTGCTLSDNQAMDDGGGVAALNGQLADEGSTWTANRGGRGGGLFSSGTALTLDGSAMIANTALTSGGGAWIGRPAALTLVRGRYWQNVSQGGGGAWHFSEVSVPAGIVAGNRVQDNVAAGAGGGAVIDGAEAAFTLSNNTLTGNLAGGVQQDGEGAGIYVAASAPDLHLVANIVAWSQGASGLYRSAAGGSTTHNTVFNTTSGVNLAGTLAYLDYAQGGAPPEAQPGEEENRVENPAFVTFAQDGDPALDDLHLKGDSPARDTGPDDDAFDDLDGSRADRGAYGGPWATP